MDRPHSGIAPAILLVLACILWGAATVINKALLGPVQPIPLLVLQLLPGAAALLLASFSTRARFPSGRTLWLAVLLGVLNPGVSYSLSMLGLDRISASVAALMWATEPILILVLARLILGEPITPRLTAVVALGLLGVAFVAGLLGGAGALQADPIGAALVFGAVLLCAVYTVFSRSLGASVEPLPLVAVQQCAGLIWALALLVGLFRGDAVASMTAVPVGTAMVALFTGFIYYGLSYWLYLKALRHVPAAVAGAYFNIIPLAAIGLASVFLGERLSPFQSLGAALILVSGLLLVRLTRRAG